MTKTNPSPNRVPKFAAICVVAVATSCGGASMTSYSPVNEKTKFSADSLHVAARDAAEELGHRPVGSDSGSYVLDTREKEVATSSIPRLSYKYSFHIETKDGVLAIQANCQQNSATAEKTFKDCGDDRPERVVDEQNTLHRRILELAPSIQSKNPDWSDFGKPEEEASPAEKADKDEKKADKDEKKADKDEKKADKKADKDEKKADKDGEQAKKKGDDVEK